MSVWPNKILIRDRRRNTMLNFRANLNSCIAVNLCDAVIESLHSWRLQNVELSKARTSCCYTRIFRIALPSKVDTYPFSRSIITWAEYGQIGWCFFPVFMIQSWFVKSIIYVTKSINVNRNVPSVLIKNINNQLHDCSLHVFYKLICL